MRALNPRVKRSGLIAALLAGVLLVGVDEAGAKGMGGMSGHVGLGNGRPPAFNNTTKPITSYPGAGTSKPGKTGSKPGKTYGDHDRDKDRKERKAERKREREERKAKRKGSCVTRGTCVVGIGKPIPGKPAPQPVLAAPIGKPVPVVNAPGVNPIKNPDPVYTNGPPGTPAKGAGGNPSDQHGTGSTSIKQQ
jgi:hypothetical protein